MEKWARLGFTPKDYWHGTPREGTSSSSDGAEKRRRMEINGVTASFRRRQLRSRWVEFRSLTTLRLGVSLMSRIRTQASLTTWPRSRVMSLTSSQEWWVFTFSSQEKRHEFDFIARKMSFTSSREERREFYFIARRNSSKEGLHLRKEGMSSTSSQEM